MIEEILCMCRAINPSVPNDPKAKLIDEGYIDSFGAYAVLVQIEIEMNIVIPENEICYENFQDIEHIVEMINKVNVS